MLYFILGVITGILLGIIVLLVSAEYLLTKIYSLGVFKEAPMPKTRKTGELIEKPEGIGKLLEDQEEDIKL